MSRRCRVRATGRQQTTGMLRPKWGHAVMRAPPLSSNSCQPAADDGMPGMSLASSPAWSLSIVVVPLTTE